jgi:hypothetical protein
MESARIAGGRLVDCPIEEYIDEDGDLSYVVLLVNGNPIEYMLGESMPLEEARAHIRELMFVDITNGRYDLLHMQLRAGLALLPDAAVDVAWEEPSYLHHSFNAVPASAMAVADLQETVAVGEGQCSVCLEALEKDGTTKLRVMPCSHSFHEDCIFTWLRVGHSCPLCRFPLPTKQQD